ncbi:Protein RALF-like 33 [Hibiscus syriacus]|uniref:Protein RALF-like 33 n=1 Tax=Hibiscus syriacus TaxID=106335 RepID=A0A6A2YRD5_HIBSY|nr:protein RALF-like 1 [Hibiscus syriacus]KAE8681933.1 Protein RALF-like 33 [Hibiscus syriacus]
MASTSGFLLTISLLLLGTATHITSVSAYSASGVHGLTWIPTTTNESGSSCRGSTAECMANDMDDGLELTRRMLQTANTQYISYGALQRDTVPCSLRGASYYNCQPGAQANPYNRGCSAIARCRG